MFVFSSHFNFLINISFVGILWIVMTNIRLLLIVLNFIVMNTAISANQVNTRMAISSSTAQLQLLVIRMLQQFRLISDSGEFQLKGVEQGIHFLNFKDSVVIQYRSLCDERRDLNLLNIPAAVRRNCFRAGILELNHKRLLIKAY